MLKKETIASYFMEQYFSERGAKRGEDPLHIRVYEELPSTNKTLKELANAGAPEGTVLFAERQSAGRGRLGRSFYSPGQSGIYMSILLRPTMETSDAVMVTTMAAAATALAIEEVTGKETKIKWVNDIFVEEKKVCGILAEGSISPTGDGFQYIVVGIGINVFASSDGFPDELKQVAAAIYERAASEQELDAVRSRLAAAVLSRFMDYYHHTKEKEYYKAYQDRCFVIGKRVTIVGRTEKEEVEALGLDEACGLMVRHKDGRIETLTSGEISIRMHK